MFSGIWPPSGSMRSGTCFERQTSARPTSEPDSSSWPTPTASEYGSSQNGINGVGGEFERPSAGTPSPFTLARHWPTPTARDWRSGESNMHGTNARPLNEVVVKLAWPTPRATDGEKGGPNQRGRKGDLMLPSAAVQSMKLWPTPKAHDALSPRTADQIKAMKARAPKRTNGGPPGLSNLNETVPLLWPTPTAADANSSGAAGSTESGRHSGTTLTDATARTASPRARPGSPDGMVLNPRFVEAMMGFPDGHTVCDFSAIRSSPSKPRSLGGR